MSSTAQSASHPEAAAPAGWHPLVPSFELRAGVNVVSGVVAGHELALWRASDGATQAWDDRCPHRSVRFTLGRVVGDRLACAYHGWEYASGSGQCTRIPAHPDMPPPRGLCARTHEAVDAAGMVWVRLARGGLGEGSAGPAALSSAVPAGMHFCRTLPLRAGAADVREGLVRQGFESSRVRGSARDGTHGDMDAATHAVTHAVTHATTSADTPADTHIDTHATAHAPWQGTLDGLRTTALLLDARPTLVFLHLFTETQADTTDFARALIAARLLRDGIETASFPS